MNITINKNVMPKKVKKKVETPKGMKASPISAYWRVLHPKSEAVVEPTNPSLKLARAPTIAEQDAEFVTVKYDFDNRFDRPVFTGTKRILKRNRRGKLMREKDGKIMHSKPQVRTEGCVNPDFAKKPTLWSQTRPEEYAEIFMPFKKNLQSGRKDMFSFEQITRWKS